MAELQHKTEPLCKPQLGQIAIPALQHFSLSLISPHNPHSVTSNSGWCVCGGTSGLLQLAKGTKTNAQTTQHSEFLVIAHFPKIRNE